MRVPIFRHGPDEDAGLLEDVLRRHKIGVEYARPPLGDADGLIVLGGSMSANADLPMVREELRAIEDMMARGRPVLGICLGAQMVAKALGARVYSNPAPEIGWMPVQFTDEARSDALFQGVAGPQIIFQWHDDTFELPAGAALLASSRICENQAYRVGENVYGLQFHLEVTPDVIRKWCREDSEHAHIDPEAHTESAAELARKVFGRWCDLVRPVRAAERNTRPEV